MGRITRRTPAHRVAVADTGAPTVSSRPDAVTVEEPLEVRIGGESLAVTMRTPGDDVDLALGFLLTEGIVESAADVARIRTCTDAGEDGRPTYNVLDVTLADGVSAPGPASARPLLTTSACGVCGKASIEAVRTRNRYAAGAAGDHARVPPSVLVGMPQALRERQAVFDRTGGLHAAGLFTVDGELRAVREDVGRHNAVDKVLGWALREGHVPLTGHVLCVSGRASFELTQKALLAGVATLAAVSAPSSLAVELARESGMTLVGFLRAPTCTVYAGGQRVGIPQA